MLCYYYDAPKYLFFANDLPDLLYYSHFPAMILALLIGAFVFFNNPKALLNRLLFLIAVSFAVLTLINLVTWTNVNSSVIIFVWSLIGPLQAIISILCIYLVYVFLYQKDVSAAVKLIFTVLLLPVLLLGATNINLSGFDIAWCDAFAYEGSLYNTYYNLIGLIGIVWIGAVLVRAYQSAESVRRNEILLMGIGIEAFLLTFFTIFYIGDYLTTIKFVEDSRLELYGFFGMGFFMVMIGVLIVRFKTFNVGAHASQALVVALLVLVASQYTYANTTTTTLVLTTITLILTAVAGLIIVRSVKKEIEQRKELEVLTAKLDKANKRLKILDKMKSEFVSIASHQLRSPLTSIRGYASMLLEGSYGKLSAKAQDAVERIADSSRYMATSVEDYLNVSRIQAGNMKYEYSDFNLKDKAEHIADDIRPQAVKKGLVMTFRSDMEAKGIVHADIGKTQQIIHNLVNNSLKYTPKGSIRIQVRDQKRPKRIFVDIVDTGIGMDPTKIDDMFEKFERADEANSVNVSGTGLGLYIARKMAQEMGGDVYATSEGEGTGSTFTLELPLKL